MGTAIVANPIAQLDKIGTPVKKLTRAQQGIARRLAKFEAQRAQEEPVGMVMQDLNPGVEHQRKATFTPKRAVTQPQLGVQRPLAAPQPTIQRVSRTLEPVSVAEADGFDELEAELGGTDETAAPAVSADTDTDTSDILKRFKGTPDEVAKQIAKSYAESEKRMRQLEAEKQMLLKGQAPTAPAPVVPVTPQTNQLHVQPTFNYKRFKDDILDHGDTVAQEFEQHLTSSLDQKVAQVVAPLYEEAIDNRLFRKFGDVVTDDNLDLIKAMAQTAVGTNRWEKMVNAVNSYKTSMPGITPHELPEVQAMQKAVQNPSPQGKLAGEKKMYKQSYLKDLIDAKVKTGEYQRDPKWRRLVESAYEQGRVLRGQ